MSDHEDTLAAAGWCTDGHLIGEGDLAGWRPYQVALRSTGSVHIVILKRVDAFNVMAMEGTGEPTLKRTRFAVTDIGAFRPFDSFGNPINIAEQIPDEEKSAAQRARERWGQAASPPPLPDEPDDPVRDGAGSLTAADVGRGLRPVDESTANRVLRAALPGSKPWKTNASTRKGTVDDAAAKQLLAEHAREAGVLVCQMPRGTDGRRYWVQTTTVRIYVSKDLHNQLADEQNAGTARDAAARLAALRVRKTELDPDSRVGRPEGGEGRPDRW